MTTPGHPASPPETTPDHQSLSSNPQQARGLITDTPSLGAGKHVGADPLGVLEEVFGYHSFRGPQQAIINHMIAGQDALVLMPTGGGKSLCYQIPSMIRQGVGIVVSPLIALMQDQVDALKQNGVRAAALNSSVDPRDLPGIEHDLFDGAIDLLYMSPERLMMPRTIDLLSKSPVALFAIDEAHCVSQWGHDFRPEYQQLTVLHETFPGIPRIALTATADEPTRRDIAERLNLVSAEKFVSGFDRPNIRYTVAEKKGAHQQLLRFLKARPGKESGIVYRMSRKKTEETAAFLNGQGYRAISYHAGMSSEDREKAQRRFLVEDGLTMVATIAFGMGIDKPDVRFVAHLDLPKSVEAYYQETGRAGRDGLPAEAFMTYGMQDAVMIRGWIDGGNAPDAQKRIEHQKLNALLSYCEIATCRRKVLLRYFGDIDDTPSDNDAPHEGTSSGGGGGGCGNCDTCLTPPETYDGKIYAQKALSCVYRTGQRYGTAYIADVLVGSTDDRITRNGHDQLPTYGVGKDTPKTQWVHILRQLAAQGILHIDPEHGSLAFTDQSSPVLKGQTSIHFRKESRPAPAPGSPGRGASGRQRGRSNGSASGGTGVSALEALETGEEKAVFEALRSKRSALAETQGVPAYIVFPDRTLIEMAKTQPKSLEAMSRITGVGAKKLEQYGQTFLEVITG